MDKLNSTTYKKIAKDNPKDLIELEVGDSKDLTKFQPQTKIMRWDNECNVSLRLVHDEKNPTIKTEGNKIVWEGDKVAAHFYELKKKEEQAEIYTKLRFIEKNDVSSVEYSAIWDLPAKVVPKLPTLIVAKPKEQMFNIGSLTPLSEYHNIEKILCEKSRIYNPTRGTGGLIFEKSTLFFFLVIPNKDSASGNLVRQSISEVCQKLGIETKCLDDNNDIYFKIGDKWKKFSGQLSQTWGEWTIFITTLALDFNAVSAREIYKLDSEKFTKKGIVSDIADIVGGLHEVLPEINSDELKRLISEKIANKLSLTLQPDIVSEEENLAMENSLEVLSSEDWILNGFRNDRDTMFPAIDIKEGASEFEIILKEKPATNKVEFTLVDKDVDYFYQPSLTREEFLSGSQRPVNIVGSYVVYASENKKNYVGGKEYKNNQVGIIYRPKIIDSAGTEVLGDLHIENGILSVTIPQDFLDKAVYPVRHAAGLTFGYTTAGGTASGTKNSYRGSLFTGGAGTLDKITISSNNSYNTVYGACAVYLHSDLSKVALSESKLGDNTFSQHWVDYTCGNEIMSAVDYILTFISGAYSKSNRIDIYYNAGDANQGNDAAYSGNTNPVAAATTYPTVTHNTNKYSIYATYTAAASGPANLKSRSGNLKANIKSMSGNLIANCKSLSGNA